MQLGFIGTGEITSSIVTDRRGRGGLRVGGDDKGPFFGIACRKHKITPELRTVRELVDQSGHRIVR